LCCNAKINLYKNLTALLYQGVKDSKRPLDKGENVCEANEGDLRRWYNNMIYMVIMLSTPNVSLTACRSIKQMPNSYVDSFGSWPVPSLHQSP